MSESKDRLAVLIIEDNKGDAFLISELLHETGLGINITVVDDGQKALEALNAPVGGESKAPDLIILDLNLPGLHGFDVLARIKAEPSLRSIPVVVMTGSLNKDDEKRARGMGVTDYRIKPVGSDDFDIAVRWLKKNLAPLVGSKRRSNAHKDEPATMALKYSGRRCVPRTGAPHREPLLEHKPQVALDRYAWQHF